MNDALKIAKSIRPALRVRLNEGGDVNRKKNLADFQAGNHPDVPHVVYHGTNKDFSIHDPEMLGSNEETSHQTSQLGHWLTGNPEQASEYAIWKTGHGANVQPVHISLKKPAILDWDDIREKDGWDLQQKLIKKGHDGAIVHSNGPNLNYVVFAPHQIKSATGNNGNFDPNDPDITKAEGGEAEGYEPHKRAEEQGYEIKGYHVTRGTHARQISSAKRFDPSHNMINEPATFFWDDPNAANEWAKYVSGVDTFNPSEINESDMDRLERHATSVMPVRIKKGKHLVVNWPEETGKNEYNNSHMAKILNNAAAQGYDTVRIKNMSETGPMSVEDFEKAMHTGEYPEAPDQIAVLNPSMVRSEFAHFDPARQHENDIGAKKGGYIDPETKHIQDWKWRPLEDVQSELGLTEIPSHVHEFGKFMDRTAERASREGLTPRDLIKAYTITRASIQRRATPAENLHKSGLALPSDVTGMVRPEGAFGHWLHTPAGQAYLDSAQRGQVREDAIADAVKRMAPFGRHETDIPDALRWAAQNLPDKAAAVSHLVAAGREKMSSPQEWRDFVSNIRGIGPSKAGFVASLMGRGDQPTLDARQIILHTGNPSKEASSFIAKKGGKGGEEAVDRLAARQEAMNLTTPEGMEPYYQHLTHHAVWDKAGNEETTHQDVIDAMQHAARGGKIGMTHYVAQIMNKIGPEHFGRGGTAKKKQTLQNMNWGQIPYINPQDLVGKRVFPIFADLTKAGSPYTGIDSSKLAKPEQMFGGPGYPLLAESIKNNLAWAVEGKGRGSAKIRKDADYVIVHAMEQTSHQSNASFANSLMKTMKQYVQDNRFNPEVVQQIDDMIRRPSEQKELQSLKNFPGFAHKNAENFLRKLSFEARLRVARVLESAEAQKLGAPNIDKITRATLDPEFAGVPSRAGLFVMEIPKGTEEEQLVHLKTAGLPEHPSYQYGIKGRIVGRFYHPVSPEVLYSDWFDQKKAEQKEGKTNIRRAFDLAMPTVTVSQEVADRLPHRPQDIQSGKSAKLALNAFNDQWHDTDTAVNQGGLGAAQFSQALKNSDSSSTLSQYSPDEINAMKKEGKFTGYKLKDGEVYFGLKRGTNYEDEYGFKHPDLTPNETSLVSVVNNEPGAKGVGGAPVVLKALQHGATALDAYAVPTDKHPQGFLPNFYKHFGFEELGRVPFDPKYVTEQQFADMKHEWAKTGWDEKRHGLPSLAIMKWRGSDEDRQDAVRRFVQKSGESYRAGDSGSNVGRSTGAAQQGVGQVAGGPSGERGISDTGGDRGPVRADSASRPADRFTRTLAAVKSLTPDEIQHFGLNPEDVATAKAAGLSSGGTPDRLKMSHKDVTQRVPELTEAAQKLGTDEMTPEMYQDLVDKHKPVYAWDHVPAPATHQEIFNSVRENQRGAVGKGHLIPDGYPVGLRLDIPAYTQHGVWAPTIHDKAGSKPTVLAHEPVAHISGAQFSLPENKALAVAKGTAKSPFATIDGSWKATQPADIHAMAQEYLDHPEWSQVGMDPERHSYFYDRRTQEPITHADEVLQVGPLVLAKNARSEKPKSEFKYRSGGTINSGIVEHVLNKIGAPLPASMPLNGSLTGRRH